jgi:hypothetical protein
VLDDIGGHPRGRGRPANDDRASWRAKDRVLDGAATARE